MLKFLFFWATFHVLGVLPMAALYRIAAIAGWLGYRLAPRARAAVLDNLRHIMPDASESERERAAREVFRNVACYYAEFIHTPRLDPKQFLRERLIMHGVQERILPLTERGESLIMLSAHVGNAEICGHALAALGVKTFALVEPVRPPALARMLNRIRRLHGVEFMPVGVPAVKRMMKVLRQGYVVALMGDRDIEGPRMRLPFFGTEAWLPTGPVEVALRAGVPVFPSFSFRRPGGKMEAFVEEPLTVPGTGDMDADVRTMMLEYIGRLEARLRAEPGQWAVLERIWDDAGSQPPAAAGPVAAGAGPSQERKTDG